jgi:hypothetical protein
MDATSKATDSGCLVAVRTLSSDGKFVTVGYLVAEHDAGAAVRIIKHNIARATDEVVAVSRASEELLDVLGVRRGNFMRVDGRPLETTFGCGQWIGEASVRGVDLKPR